MRTFPKLLAVIVFIAGDGLSGTPAAQTVCKTASACERACSAGDWAACRQFAEMLFTGRGAPRDKPRSVGYYRRACNGGFARACSDLGLMMEFGNQAAGVKRNGAEAARLYRLACDGKYMQACYYLGLMLRKGRGVRANKREAARLLQMACNAGSGYPFNESCFNLGEMYEKGDGIGANRSTAIAFYRKACPRKEEKSKPCAALRRLAGR